MPEPGAEETSHFPGDNVGCRDSISGVGESRDRPREQAGSFFGVRQFDKRRI